MVSRAERGQVSDWWWTVDRWLLSAFIMLMVLGVVLSFSTLMIPCPYLAALKSLLMVPELVEGLATTADIQRAITVVMVLVERLFLKGIH